MYHFKGEIGRPHRDKRLLSDDQTVIQSKSALFIRQKDTVAALNPDANNNYAMIALKKGDIIDDKYVIEGLLGEGGMGAVYQAHHRLLNKTVALKTFKTMPRDATTIHRFQKEATALAKLNAPGVVQIYDYGLTAGEIPYYTMEYLRGESLADKVRGQGGLAVDEALNIFIDACEGLLAAHKKNILHRDIKPSNIFLENNGGARPTRIKLVDFGLATSAKASDQNTTEAGIICGSPLYMSPEQSRGEALTASSDIYSLGCALYETLTGRPPFLGANSLQTIIMHSTEEAPALGKYSSNYFSPELELTIASMLKKAPEKRPQSASDVLERLKAIAQMKESKLSKRARSSEDKVKAGSITGAIIGGVIVLLLLAVGAYYGLIEAPKHAHTALNLKDLKKDAPVARSFVEGGKTWFEISWPGHEIGHQSDHDQGSEIRDKMVWMEEDKKSIIFGDEFSNDVNNFNCLRTLPLSAIRLTHVLERAKFLKLLHLLAEIKTLRILGFERQPMQDEDLDILNPLDNIQDISLRETQVTGPAFLQFIQKKKIKLIGFRAGLNPSSLIRGLAGDKDLRKFDLVDTQLNHEDFRNLGTMGLYSASLRNTNLHDEDLPYLLPLKYVISGDLQDNPITAKCAPTLKQWAAICLRTNHRKMVLQLSEAGWTEAERKDISDYLTAKFTPGNSVLSKKNAAPAMEVMQYLDYKPLK